MKLYKNKEFIQEINSIEDLLVFIMERDVNFKSLTPTTLERCETIIKTDKMNLGQFSKSLKQLFYYGKPHSLYSEDFWKIRGYTDSEAKENVHTLQSKNGKLYKEKYGVCLSPSHPIYWINIGMSSEEANLTVSKIMSERSRIFQDNRMNDPESYDGIYPNQVKYWMSKGYNEDKSKVLVSNYQRKFSLEICINKYGESKGFEIWETRQEKWLKSFNHTMGRVPLVLEDKGLYYSLVWRETNKHKHKVENIHLRSPEYHLDHKYSINRGFIENIPPYLIGGLNNLEIIPSSENMSKQDNCSISSEEL